MGQPRLRPRRPALRPSPRHKRRQRPPGTRSPRRRARRGGPQGGGPGARGRAPLRKPSLPR
eukprot:7316090-Lingulodinium_polyedra.AAC.1